MEAVFSSVAGVVVRGAAPDSLRFGAFLEVAHSDGRRERSPEAAREGR